MKFVKLFAMLILTSMSFACVDATEEEVAPDSEFGLETLDTKSDSNVIRDGSPESDAILGFCNQPLADDAEGDAFRVLVDSKLHATAAKNIAKYRAGKDGKFGTSDDQEFADLESLDAVPYVGPAALQALLILAKEAGYLALTGSRETLQKTYADHTYLDYRTAREHMFSTIDNRDGTVEGVYTGMLVNTLGIPDSTTMNCEHTWPRSQLRNAGTTAAETDLHHLFPASSFANSKRSNFPFGTVVSPLWSEGGSTLGRDMGGNIVFEVRPSHRGNTARAMFYISVMYDLKLSPTEEATLRAWSQGDLVDAAEKARNSAVEAVQGNRNPFVDDPTLVSQIADF